MRRLFKFRFIIAVLVCAFCLSGCKFFYSTKLQAPKLSHNKTDMTIFWDANSNASDYDIYMNSVKIDTIQSDGSTQYEYCYEDAIGEFGEFLFQVKAIGTGKFVDSKLSDAVSVKVGTAISYLEKNISDIEYQYDVQYAPTNVNVSGGVISWNSPISCTNLSGYLVSIFTNTLGIVHYECDDNSLPLTDTMASGHDVMAIKVSSVIGGYNSINYEAKDIYYYNPLNYGVFTDTIYVFDGGVYDYYIENYIELQNLYYYSFIYRLENVRFKVSEEFYRFGEDTYFNTFNGIADSYIYDAYLETMGKYNVWPRLVMTSGDNEFRLNCQYTYSGSPRETGTPYYKQDINYAPYYETIDYEKRPADYDNFESDNWFLSTEVDSSEELFWAVSNHVTPTFPNTTNNAYIIYNNAKTILKEIISDEMSDYEKALSIYDYIILNSTYDINTVNSMKASDQINAFDRMCYYMESLLLDIESDSHVAVCDAYCKTYALLCNMEGINCVRVTGTVDGEGHGWNKIELNGIWYVVDITWSVIYDDYNNELTIVPIKGINYLTHCDFDEEECAHTYFLVDDDFISRHKDYNNRYIYSLLDAPNPYNFYVKDKICGKYSRIIETAAQLSEILNHSIINDMKGTEIIFTKELCEQYKDSVSDDVKGTINEIYAIFMNILKASKTHNFMAMEYFCSEVFIDYGIVEYNNVYYTYLETYPETFYYDLEDETKEGYLVIIKPSVSLYTDLRLENYIKLITDNSLTNQSRVSITTEMINKWISSSIDKTTLDGYIADMNEEDLTLLVNNYINSLSDTEKIELMEDFMSNKIGIIEGDIDYKVEVEISRIEEDITQTSNFQNDDETWEQKTFTSGEYSFIFNYVEM